MLTAAFGLIVDRARRGVDTSFGGLGFFYRRDLAARVVRSPRTGAPVAVAARSVLAFEPSMVFAAAIRGDYYQSDRKGRKGRDALHDAMRGTCSLLLDSRQRELTEVGSDGSPALAVWACDGEGAAGLGAWVHMPDGGWACASGAVPLRRFREGDPERVIDAVQAAVTVSLRQEGVVAIRDFGAFSVARRSARTQSVPVWSGGSVQVALPIMRHIKFAASGAL